MNFSLWGKFGSKIGDFGLLAALAVIIEGAFETLGGWVVVPALGAGLGRVAAAGRSHRERGEGHAYDSGSGCHWGSINGGRSHQPDDQSIEGA